MSFFSQLLSSPSANPFYSHNSFSSTTRCYAALSVCTAEYQHFKFISRQQYPAFAKFGMCIPLVGAGVRPATSSLCISSTAFLAPAPERNKKPSDASSKQAKLGTMVSQFRKLRFPLTIKTTCSPK